MTREVLEPLGAFVLSLLGAGMALWYARRTGLVDFPNQRSSHSVPTPRGGGIALVSSVLVVSAVGASKGDAGPRWVFFLLLAAVVALSFVGWRDDRAWVPIGLRLCAHLACGLAVALLVNEIAPLPGVLNIAWLGWWVFWTVASINIVNFMDGVDGMIASQGIVYGVFLFVLLSGSTLGGRFGLILAGACLGFLVWNWSPARMFMGDVGSGPLGLFFVIGGALALKGAPAALVFLPLFPLFLDALVTVVIRFRRGERLTDAHRSHLYQRLANGGYGHARVTAIYAAAAAVGAVVALWVKGGSASRTAGAIIVYVVLVLIAWTWLHEKFAEAPTTNRSSIAELNS